MATKPSVEEIEPFCKWQKEEQQDVLEVHLQGFKKDQLRVQINDLDKLLMVSGEGPLDQNKCVRFYEEVKVSEDCKRDEIRAKFSGGILYITMPKRIPTQNQQFNGTAKQNDDIDKNAGNAKQNDGIDKNAGTSGTSSMMSKPSECISGLKQMGGKSALKIGALAAVMVVAVVVAYVAYKYRWGFHVEH